jgi:hypothetical protein
MQVIGRIVKVSFLDFGIKGVRAKVDTGSFRSTIHCHDIKIVEKNGKSILTVKLLDPDHPLYNDKVLRFDKFSQTRVKSIFGETQQKYYVPLKITILERTYEAEFILTNRQDLMYTVLLGSTLLEGNFMIDLSKRLKK